MYRTMKLPPLKDANEGVGSAPHCILCGKKVRPDRMWAVHIVNGGGVALHPDDEGLYTDAAADLGCHMVGPECRKQLGEYAFKWA